MKQLLVGIALLVIFPIMIAPMASAVGELLGLHVEIALSDGTSVSGQVVGETESSIRVEDSGTVVVVDREMIVEISLLEVDEPEGDSSLRGSSEFENVQDAAMRKSAIWSLGKDSIQVAQTIVMANCVKDTQAICRTEYVITYIGLGVASIIWDIATKPSVEERLFWQSRLPGWYGILSLGEGLVGLGASVSLVVGVVQEQIDSTSIAPAQVWYERSAMLYLLKAGLRAIRVLYDLSVIASPS